MALTDEQKAEIREVVVETLSDLYEEHGTYGEVRQAFAAERKAAAKAAKAAEKAAAEGVSETAAAQPDPKPIATVQSTNPTAGHPPGSRSTRSTPTP